MLDYYPLVDDDGNISEFAEVEALDGCKTNDNKKYCTKKLKIGSKIRFSALIQASINFESEKVPVDEVKTTNSNFARIGSSNNFARIGSSNDFTNIGTAGGYTQIGTSGIRAKIASSGLFTQIASSGDYSRIGSNGKFSRIVSTGNYSVICCAGNGSIAKAKIGSWITLSEWKFSYEKNANIPICVKTEYVDGEKIKADTFYKLKTANL